MSYYMMCIQVLREPELDLDGSSFTNLADLEEVSFEETIYHEESNVKCIDTCAKLLDALKIKYRVEYYPDKKENKPVQ